MIKKAPHIIIASTIILLVALGIYFYNGYRLLESKERAVQNSWNVISEQYQERLDVLTDMEKLTKSSDSGRAEHSRTIWSVAHEANNYQGMVLATEKIDKEIYLTIALVAENPTIKSSEEYLTLSKRLSTAENALLAEKDKYNDSVTEYNRQIKVFPASVMAGPLRLSSYPYYQGLE